MPTNEEEHLATCPACQGRGKIDMTIHVVRPGQSTTVCDKPRPVSDRRRTTNPARANCKACLDIIRNEELSRLENSQK